jgi:thiosulfate/3-mercaptopyruvate sulfurtransferase
VNEIGLDELRAGLGEVVLLDVRTPREFSGAGGYPCDPRQGHIPTARNVPAEEIVAASPDELSALVGEPEGTTLVCYCHSGGRSARAAAALRAAGYDARNYEGSWHEWSREVPA